MSEQSPQPRRLADRLFGAVTPAPAPRPVVPGPEAPPSVRRAAVLVAVEGAGFVALALLLLWLTFAGEPDSVPRALAEVVLAGLVAAVLGAGAAGLWRLAGWARGPVVAVQIFLGLSGFVAAFQAGRPEIGLPILALVAGVLYLLMTPEARLAYLDR
ncbi:hypothetical protein [Candidatus Blastococcus massiliensis]|uniref:hypothetical protein n=1 Tax=Candidatus Blastococcus massiliensis TaxID=1470358 RepID=UPI0004B37B3C|nr:hypothetical protein [Candidatus Blastococcus massiliensis]